MLAYCINWRATQWVAPTSAEERGEVRLLKPGTVERHLPKVFEGLFESGEGKQYMSTLGMVAAYVKEETPEHGVKHTYLDSGTNPAKGAVITYYLAEAPESTIELRIDDADGNEVKTFKSLHADEEDVGATLVSPAITNRRQAKRASHPVKCRLESLHLGPAISGCAQGGAP